MINSIVIGGRLTKDPELRQTQSGTSVTTFTVACDRDYGEKATDFINCVAWRSGAEFVSKYFTKGSAIIVRGALQSRKWQDKEGHNRIEWEVNAEQMWFGESKREHSGATATPKPISAVDFNDLDEDGPLPWDL